MAPVFVEPATGDFFWNVREVAMDPSPPFIEGCFHSATFFELRREMLWVVVHIVPPAST
ncbi:hypothetical protein [Microvirga sp. VF16]|uniref:hypothetical protein n=1 Tax=Microvirga sp. VF16 TaxID=2807101 RepID=UPI00193CA38A|nr:hypothetical protein [Microvirga sp. VF16]QRM34975.1 hypothetical protein JO965_42710 [Microvirga sp. VF16]